MGRPGVLIALAVAGGVAGSRIYAMRNGTWGATPAEAAGSLPGDDLAADAFSISTMAITIAAPPEKVWPWLVQMGADRAGFYSHEWVENGLLHLDIHNADRIVPEWQDLTIGDVLRYVRPKSGRADIGPVVVAMEPERAIITGMGEAPDWAATWQFILRPWEGDRTRLLVRLRLARTMPKVAGLAMSLLSPGFSYMTIGMLREIAQQAEADPVGEGQEHAPGR